MKIRGEISLITVFSLPSGVLEIVIIIDYMKYNKIRVKLSLKQGSEPSTHFKKISYLSPRRFVKELERWSKSYTHVLFMYVKLSAY